MQSNTSAENHALRIEAQPIGLFETPIAYGRLKDADAVMRELEEVIRKRKTVSKGLSRSNFGGWHSESDMLEWGGPAAQRLAEAAIKIAKRMSHFEESSTEDRQWIVRMWANVTPAGGLNLLHSHPSNLWAAVLYIDMGHENEQDSGDVGGTFIWKIQGFQWLRCVTPPFEFGGSTASLSSTRQKFSSSEGISSCFRHGCGMEFEHIPGMENGLLSQ